MQVVLREFPSPRGAWGNSTGQGGAQISGAIFLIMFPSPRGAWGNSTDQLIGVNPLANCTFPSPRGAWGNSTKYLRMEIKCWYLGPCFRPLAGLGVIQHAYGEWLDGSGLVSVPSRGLG